MSKVKVHRQIWFNYNCVFYFYQIIQAFYFTLCLINDFIGTNEVAPRKPSSLRRFKDYILAAFAFPLALNVGITFWSLMAVDRELILPKSFDSFFPRYVVFWFTNTSNCISRSLIIAIPFTVGWIMWCTPTLWYLSSWKCVRHSDNIRHGKVL